eukprot:289875_1
MAAMAKSVRSIYKLHSIMTVVFIVSLLTGTTVWIALFNGVMDDEHLLMTPTIVKFNESDIIHISNSPRYTELHYKRQQAMNEYTNHDYECDYIQVKGAGKSGTTQLKLILFHIQHLLCAATDYNITSYHYKHSPYSMCKDWTNGTADYIHHTSHYNRHAMHDIEDILLTQQSRKEHNHSTFSKYFMGNGMYDLWKEKKLRYCVFMVIRDPRNRVISRINTYNRKLTHGITLNHTEKNKLFLQHFTPLYVEQANS